MVRFITASYIAALLAVSHWAATELAYAQQAAQENNSIPIPASSSAVPAIPPPTQSNIPPTAPVQNQANTNPPAGPVVITTTTTTAAAAIAATTSQAEAAPAISSANQVTGPPATTAAPATDPTTVSPPAAPVNPSTVAAPTNGTIAETPPPAAEAGTPKMIAQYASAFSEFFATSTDMVNIDICEWGQQPRTQSVTRSFVENMAQLGSGRWNGSQWFTIVEGASTARPFGCYAPTASAIGQSGKALYPYSSAASADFELGDTIFVKDLEGMVLNPTQKHNGCLVIEGKATAANSVGIYILSKNNVGYFDLFNKSPSHGVEKKACEPITTYQTSTDPNTHL
ncbi:hypothetical protein BJ085DRAFT_37653 [Dimargaris cristalligena]|uniref:NlpC/P60 domain-containing protein n=1 Tax=Dimargaris cristalligena TaxID=215637 RepID=A0A4Q0A535_9FUNG|nr:hypothetical protein BJ085DRAFT_37653 [Dimargaris cristalligena]|eukprot:RKP40360.1 hypothetical protein BJ085DRAFT_37653 [Dimargaris cristalligena]